MIKDDNPIPEESGGVAPELQNDMGQADGLGGDPVPPDAYWPKVLTLGIGLDRSFVLVRPGTDLLPHTATRTYVPGDEQDDPVEMPEDWT